MFVPTRPTNRALEAGARCPPRPRPSRRQWCLRLTRFAAPEKLEACGIEDDAAHFFGHAAPNRELGEGEVRGGTCAPLRDFDDALGDKVVAFIDDDMSRDTRLASGLIGAASGRSPAGARSSEPKARASSSPMRPLARLHTMTLRCSRAHCKVDGQPSRGEGGEEAVTRRAFQVWWR